MTASDPTRGDRRPDPAAAGPYSHRLRVSQLSPRHGHDFDLVPDAEARARAVVATRQYAKSQRIWFRNRMRDWTVISA